MRRGRKIAVTAAVIVWVILLGFTVYYLLSFYHSLNQAVPTSEVYDQKRISVDGTKIQMQEGDIVSFESNENDYSVKVYGIESSKAKVVVNSFLYFDINAGREKRIDLDGDNVYDILIRLHAIQGSDASVSFTAIQEQRSFTTGISDSVERIGSSSGTQSKMVILILLVFALILLAYVTKEYIIPTLEQRRRMSRKSEIEAFNDLQDKFEEYKRDGNTDRARKIYDKAKHLHRYMDDADRQKTKRAIAEMANYIK